MSSSYSFINEPHRLALEFLGKEEFQTALLHFSISLETHGTSPDIYHDRALCFLKMDRPQLALDDLNKALSLQPEHGYRYASRAYVRAYLKDLEGAVEDYRKAIELDPQDAISMNNLGLIEEQFGRAATAKELFAQADELNAILRENNISGPEEIIQNETSERSTEEISTSKVTRWKVISDVIRDPNERKEFFRFIKNGFRR